MNILHSQFIPMLDNAQSLYTWTLRPRFHLETLTLISKRNFDYNFISVAIRLALGETMLHHCYIERTHIYRMSYVLEQVQFYDRDNLKQKQTFITNRKCTRHCWVLVVITTLRFMFIFRCSWFNFVLMKNIILILIITFICHSKEKIKSINMK